MTGIVNRLEKNHPVKKEEIEYLLGLSDPREMDLLFRAARRARSGYFGPKIFLYGFLYFSTYCRNDCAFCQYRKSNQALPRYRKTESEIINAAKEMAGAGVHLVDLTMGEDPGVYSPGESGFGPLVRMIQSLENEIRLPLMISPGVLPDTVLEELARERITWYACYQETHNFSLYKTLRPGQEFEKRLAAKQKAKDLGMLIEEGILTGVGESLEDLADSIVWMKEFGVDQARVMTFVPQANTPMAHTVAQDHVKECIIIAVMRLVMPEILIPASLDVDGLSGLQARLDAGANVVTSIVPPQKGLAGVAHHSLDIEDSRRTVDQLLPVLKTCGLEPALPEEYRAWTAARMDRTGPSFQQKGA